MAQAGRQGIPDRSKEGLPPHLHRHAFVVLRGLEAEGAVRTHLGFSPNDVSSETSTQRSEDDNLIVRFSLRDATDTAEPRPWPLNSADNELRRFTRIQRLAPALAVIKRSRGMFLPNLAWSLTL
ncbi:hypothetical protein T02_11300 [Trichinella nativa]|uniref:Uncharacterized protein n=1 Tax=Trichinella nativa TaxID=6335 RepID=A0A0V1L1B7_9BILA|nr:hypothetical protein T02_11300 [Trichinella nativa]